MRNLTVEAFEDLSRPGGGHAIIRVKGLADVPDNLTFRLRPADGSSALDRPGGWPEGERRPLSTRVTPEGTELLVGPEIVESPHLLPGTLAILDIPKCGVRGEFLWPSIQPIARPKRRHVVAARAIKDMRPGSSGDELPMDGAHQIAFAEATDASSQDIPSPANDDVNEGAWTKVLAEVVPPPPDAPLASPPSNPPPPSGGPKAEPELKPPPALTPGSPRWAEDPATKRQTAARTLQAAMLVIAFCAGVAASAWHPWQTTGSGTTAAPQALGTSRISKSGPTAELLALIEPARTSPGGLDAASIHPSRLLERADALLATPPSGPDLEEARYLLRRYLTLHMSERRTLWALTQLGSLYAEPGGGKRPDYAQAAGVWEVAASLGDPVAMCFLASLQEHGLAIAPDRQAALGWYLSAKAAGGCAGVDDAIGRLRR